MKLTPLVTTIFSYVPRHRPILSCEFGASFPAAYLSPALTDLKTHNVFAAGAAAISCYDQGTPTKPAVCMLDTSTPCPLGYRPVFYDLAYPCAEGQRCCI
jgi:hypothetical protein